MTFLSPGRLLALLAVAVLVAAYVVLALRRRSVAVRFTELDLLASVAPRRPGWRRHVPPAAFALMLVALCIGWARPQADTRVASERATVMLALDVSNSMNATDVSPDRFTQEKRGAAAFISSLPARLRVGLVVFDRAAREVAAPTQDHSSVVDAVQALQLGPGTAIGEAVYTSLSAVQRDATQQTQAAGGELPPPPARIVLLSDGGNTAGRDPSSAATDAKAAGVPVSTIAYGTQDGSVTINGVTIPVPADVGALRALATDSGGTAYTAASGSELRSVYRDIGSQVGTTTKLTEVTSWLVGLGLLAGLVAALASLAWSPRFP